LAVIKITYKHNHTNHNTSSVLSLFYSGTTDYWYSNRDVASATLCCHFVHFCVLWSYFYVMLC